MYKTEIFDCDGVLLKSNQIKNNVFFEIAKKYYGEELANIFIKYVENTAGISRYEKFNHLINLGIEKYSKEFELNILLNEFSDKIFTELIECEITPGIECLKKSTIQNKLVISGSDQKELRQVFKHKGLYNLFKDDIYGSPKNKYQIVQKKINENKIIYPVIFFGDSEYDYNVSKHFNFDFIFLYNWTDFKEYKFFFEDKNVSLYKDLKEYYCERKKNFNLIN